MKTRKINQFQIIQNKLDDIEKLKDKVRANGNGHD